jgi:class 3 adenylate cyclase
MFCDLVDSTGIAAKLDAEKWRDLVGAYLEAASLLVYRRRQMIEHIARDGDVTTPFPLRRR